jgi:signal transduction histidine kinase
MNDLAHELRSPLAAIQATLEGMIDGVLPTDTERLSIVNREVIRMGGMIRDQLDLTSLENGTTPIRLAEVDLSLLVGDLILIYQVLAENADLALTYHAEPDIEVRGDYQLLNRAVTNLLANAIRYTPGGGRISVRVCRDTEDSQNACIIVADSGIGIAEEHQEKIFARFWQVDKGHSHENAHESGGLGLGLAMVREIVLQHEGRIEVESTLGEGSTFTIRLPLLVR